MADYTRPLFRDRILHEYEGNSTAQFDIRDRFLPLLNEIKQPGTFIVSGQMNNLFYFYNLIGLSFTKYRAFGFGTSVVTEIITEREEIDPETGDLRLIAKNITETLTATSWKITEELYDINEFGQNALVQKRIITYSKMGNEWEAIVE